MRAYQILLGSLVIASRKHVFTGGPISVFSVVLLAGLLVAGSPFEVQAQTATLTVTPTPTETATPTPLPPCATANGAPGPLNHFVCYEIDKTPPTPAPPLKFERIFGLALEDQFGPNTMDVIYPKRLCNPADKNDENPPAPDDLNHLIAYQIKRTSTSLPFVRRLVQVTNQFGTHFATVTRPEMLMVPTTKCFANLPDPAPNPIDHYQCYRVRGIKTQAFLLKIDDQFGTLTIDVRRPFRLCAPVDKNGEGINDPAAHLMCYKVRTSPRTPRFKEPGPFFVNNQFNPFMSSPVIRLTGLRELCVPTVKTLVAPTEGS